MNNCLDKKCGDSIDMADMKFLKPSQNLVYMDKMYSFQKGTSCPIIYNLDTGKDECGKFIIEISTFGGISESNCCCNCCESSCEMNLDEPPSFHVTNSYAKVTYFNTRPAGNTDCMTASFDGSIAPEITYSNGQYLVNTSDLDSQIQNSACAAMGLPTKCFFLLTDAGPWMYRATYYLEGTVSANGKTCCFKAKIFNADNEPNTYLPLNSFSNFAVPDLALPCNVGGISPSVFFSFGAKINPIAPKLILDPINGGLRFITNLSITPTIQVQVVRKSLFKITANEALLPCDNVSEDEDFILCNFNNCDSCCDPHGDCHSNCQSDDNANACSFAKDDKCSCESNDSYLWEDNGCYSCEDNDPYPCEDNDLHCKIDNCSECNESNHFKCENLSCCNF